MVEDDNFIREVNEEIRQEKLQKLWRNYGALIIGAAILLVFAASGWAWYNKHMENRDNAAGDAMLAALQLADRGDEAAFAKLTELEKSGIGGYPVLAKMRAAALLATKDDKAGAVAAYDAIAGDKTASQGIRDLAAIRAAYLLVDNGTLADVRERVEALATDVNPMRNLAREALGLAAWKAGALDEATGYFTKNRDDQQPLAANLRERAQMMLDLISVQRGGAQK
ncbi:MAG: Hypothetical protein BHV28_13790 [Candidatus Tokpelaia hoelldobleri]|uniref:Ancillary SecYEG translocon subunit/Cell division coordinator CpoB TPR domain-containing protein n=1 Tax=Candidatus Tokpelaia hoelldobleri TaxID=1902579 RepID=A0A1U9JW09_9HYPH|nr:MAG: Hypothetical protein BHV28_13790 [Candidatus Tokpelaia hoelldoblerii]